MNKRLKEIVEQHHIYKDVLSNENTSNIILQTRRKQQRTLGTQTGYKDTRNSGGSMDEQTREHNTPMESNSTVVPTRATAGEQRQKVRKQKEKHRSGNREMRIWLAAAAVYGGNRHTHTTDALN